MLTRISQLLKWGVARFADALGARLLRPDGTVLSIPYSLGFPDFSPSILASFVAGTTASQAGNTVTVTATAHGIVGSNAKNGARIYYPGSASIPAGWYPGFAWVDANTITFIRATSATVASESVNGGAIFTALTTIFSLTLPGGAMGTNGRLSFRGRRVNDSSAGNTKVLRLAYGGQLCGYWGMTGTAAGLASMSIVNKGVTNAQGGVVAPDGAGSTPYEITVDSSVDQTVSLQGSLSAAAGYILVDFAELEVVRR